MQFSLLNRAHRYARCAKCDPPHSVCVCATDYHAVLCNSLSSARRAARVATMTTATVAARPAT